MKKTILGCFLAFGMLSAQAQVAGQTTAGVADIRYDNRSSAPLFIRFNPDVFISAGSGMEGLNAYLQGGSNDSWKLIRNDADDIGMNHRRYQQYYQQVKVVTGEYILHERQGRVVSANGMFYRGINLSTVPSFTEKNALDAALRTIGASKYLWQASAAEQELWLGHAHASAYPKGELVVIPQTAEFNKTKANVLCWAFDVYSIAPHERWMVYVNAQNGEVVFRENRICTITVNGTAVTRYSGTQTIKVDSVSATNYRLRDASRGGGVETYNLANGTTYVNTDFTDTDNNWNPGAPDNAALDAHWGAEKTYDYYMSVHNRNSYNNLGSVLRSYVHYSSGYNNAFWNGSVMTYGDGDGSTFSPLTEMDICAHELTHGVTSTSSNLTYSYQSGALNESFSDIFGVTVDFFARPAQANWTMADQSYTPATPGDGIRYMNNPNLAGDPDTYLGTNWYTGTGDNGGVHYNSGVQNFWYYLLCQGGTGTNDNGFAYNVASITMTKARMIAFRNNTFYLTSGSQYSDAGYYSLQAATDLYGPCSPEAYAVKNAWDAVGVMGLSLNASATASVSGGTCAGSNIQLTASGGTSYSWTGPGGYTSTLQNPVITAATSANNGTYTCVVTAANGCSGSASVTLNVSTPPSVTATGGVSVCNGGSAQLTATASVPGQGGNSATNTTPLPIPDSPSPGVTSNMTISGSTTANAVVSVTIDSLTHTYDGDLKIELVAPNGSAIILASGVGGSGDNFIRTKFQTGGTAIASGAAPFTGTYAPSQAFSGLTGSANGTWGLRITDLGGQDIGTLWKWSLVLPGNSIVSYSWNPATGLNNASIANPLASPASTTTYTVTVTDNSGCTAAASTTVTIGTLSTTLNSSNVSCFGGSNGSATVSASGSNTYLWSNGANTGTISGLAAGNYTCTVTNSNGCTAVRTASISQPAALNVSAQAVNAGCASATGSASAQVSGGTAGYTYIWNTGSTASSISGLAAGTYTVTATDANGCSGSATAVVNASSSNLAVTPSSVNVSCNGVNNGSASLAITGASGNTTILWSNGANTSSISNLAAGTYGYTVTDGAGCSVSGSVNITAPAYLDGFVTTQNANCSLNDGSAYSTIYGGTAPYAIQWSNGATTPNISGLAPGSYTIYVTDANGCSFASTGIVGSNGTAAPATPGSITGTKLGVCAGVTKTYTCPSVANATSYNWTVPANTIINSGQGTTSISVTIQAGFVSGNVTVTASNNCGTSNAKSITVRSTPQMPSTITGPSNNLCGGASTYSIPASTTGATSYTWTVPAGATIVSGQGTTSINVQWSSTTAVTNGSVCVTANNACGSSAARCKTSITTLPLKPTVINGPASVCANQTNLTYSVATQPGVTYTWTAPSGASILSGQGTGSVVVKWRATTGYLNVKAVNSCGATSNKSLQVVVTCREGLDEAVNVSLAPNPAKTETELLFSNDPGTYVVTVTDMLGQTLRREQANGMSYLLDMSNQAAGIYVVSVELADGTRKVMRLVLDK